MPLEPYLAQRRGKRDLFLSYILCTGDLLRLVVGEERILYHIIIFASGLTFSITSFIPMHTHACLCYATGHPTDTVIVAAIVVIIVATITKAFAVETTQTNRASQ